METIKKDDVVQFTENHKWRGCLGVVEEVKQLRNDIRYMVGVLVPKKGMAYIYTMDSEKVIERIGAAVMVSAEQIERDDE